MDTGDGRSWLTLPSHQLWLDIESSRLLDFGTTLDHPAGGSAWLDGRGNPDLDHPAHTYITARMAHVHFLASMLGRPGSRRKADRVFEGLLTTLRDSTNGGWFESSADATSPDAVKSAYTHAFVVLAASAATAVGHPHGLELLDEALDTVERRFWDDHHGMCSDTWTADWSVLDDYRGINANMHMVEALLAAADAGAPQIWRERALRICDNVCRWAEANDWRVPEHFTAEWIPQLEYNSDDTANQFKPYGATVGHGFEWARLLVQASLVAASPRGHDYVAAAASLYHRAAQDGWQPGPTPGFVYTTDWTGRPVVAERLHWVLCEAIAAAATLGRRTGEDRYAKDYREWWDVAADAFVDCIDGSWHHELDSRNVPAATVWSGKPDLYHAVQATWISRYRINSSMMATLRGPDTR
ncbi:AGE family epimerase/isomerase [Rhodococcus sp. IEGM 1401]|uniref:AGE family epimerase/isomerase n=1 Tax=unclassified Rhodococcus (in: high G+C Gram-positive bacteria) TaxID=192944 RepID=UPI0022B55DB3|nr:MULTISPECIES: AGE family epimerase/isomerase [unclassified Rhodococcus (in: high G+C Gram-positive bacteria)]MCZ4562932.1 AGE family epimerase/isomerase [Rhodococcus sp. IEGM 1401]MDI9923037.1 AGE family epimerase/isomerase [Rhodococcus sp. IEGM 1372]MDV8035602.1 AGE family epimerase/isomerase [Rhodococcus sp. IEGM 1414]